MHSLKFQKSSLVSFALGLLGVVLMMLFHSLGVRPFEIIRPLVAPEVRQGQANFLKKVDRVKETIKVKNNSAYLPKAYASSDFDEAPAYAGVNFDDGTVLLEKNIDMKLPIASLTKIMTAVVSLDLFDSGDLFEVRSDAAKIIPTKIGVVPGQKMILDELLTAMILTSANDAAQVIADGIDKEYGEGSFVEAMNEKARVLGLKDSHFANPQGFDSEKNYSTVSDLAVLTNYALKNYPLISEIAKKDYEFLPENSLHKQFDLYNWNGLLDVYPETIGLKIGNTDDAKYTTVVVSNRGGRRIIAIVLGAPGVLERDLWASEILDSAYIRADNLAPVNVTKEELLAKYKTWKYWN